MTKTGAFRIGLATLCVALATSAFAGTGVIKDLFPPGSNGPRGMGRIDETDAAGRRLGPPYWVFQIPNDVADPSNPPKVGDLVTFDPVRGQRATNVMKIPGTTSTSVSDTTDGRNEPPRVPHEVRPPWLEPVADGARPAAKGPSL